MRPGSPDDESFDDESFDDDDGADDLAGEEAAASEPRIAAARWHVDRTALVAKIIGVVAFALIPQVLGLGTGSRWFGLLLALVFAVYAARDVLAPVRLSADAEGVTVVRGYAGHRRLPWSEVERLRVGSQRRAEFLEVDTGDSVHLFSRYDLGMPPTQALAMLERIRP
jgi:hypothetical protein